jgi:formylglycine-generating enzyme required for sulfatase activity
VPRGLISRGDLLRALIRQGGALSAQAVEALGYVPKPPKQPEPPDLEKDVAISDQNETEQQPERLISQAPLDPLPFWQPVSLEPDEIEHPDVRQGTAPTQPPQRKSGRPPAYHYLASFKELVPRLRAALSAHRLSRAYDISCIVSRIAQGETLHYLPRRPRAGWGSSLYVIEDRSNHLAPYVRDQAMVQCHLRQLYAPIGFHQALYSEWYARPQVFWPDGRVTAIEPQPGDQVLVLGDLGGLARDGGHATLFWSRFGEELRDRGVAALALLPCAPAECPDLVAGLYHLLSWEHPAPPVLAEDEWEARGAQLLAHLSIVPRIEPRLLREVRLGLGTQAFPARMEAWAWQHPVMAEPDMVATALASKEALARHKVFRQGEDKRLGVATLRAAKASMTNLPYELWLETAINFGDWDDEVISAQERQDGVTLLNYLAGRVGAPGGLPLSERAMDWLEDFYQRLSDEVKVAPETKQACWVLAGALVQKGKPKVVSNQPRPIQLYQQGGEIHMLAQQASQKPGSHLADISSQDGLIRLEHFHVPLWADHWGRNDFGTWVEFLYEGVRQRLRWIAPGRFMMGSPESEPGRYDSEGPQHEVVLRQGYWLFDTPVTQALWQAVMGANPSRFKSPGRPVEQVSWDDCQRFLHKLNGQIPGLDLTLPSEAQWEYACRAGEPAAVYTGGLEILGDGNAPALDPIAWYGGNSGVGFELEEGHDIDYLSDRQFNQNPSGPHPVGQKQPNRWGLYDMLGNVWEWTADAWHENYAGAPRDGSVWDEGKAGAGRVVRGGSWVNGARYCRSAHRGWSRPVKRLGDLGFRPARVQV